MALTRGVSSIHRPPPGLQPISATEGALRPALPPTCPSMGSRAAPTDGSCGSQSTEHKAQLTCSSPLSDGEESKGERSSTPRPSPRVRVSRTFSVSAQHPRHRHRGLLAGWAARVCAALGCRTDGPPVAGQPLLPPGGCGGPSAVSPAPPPLPAPQAEPRAPIPHPDVPSRLRADPAGLGGAWLRVPDTSDRHRGPPSPSAPTPTRVPRKGSPRVLGRCHPGPPRSRPP